MSRLILVGTSIGNYDDISKRALQAIAGSELVLAEDTRVLGKLKSLMLERNPEISFNPKQKILSYREQNHRIQISKIIDYLKNEKDIVLVSDAGMPLISDPGFNLVEEVLNLGFDVDVIPGPTAVEAALVISSLETDKFIFLGFLPRKSSKSTKILDEVVGLKYSIVVYESPFRVKKLLELLRKTYGELKVAACNDLTKKFQKVYRGEVSEVLTKLPEKLKGEWTLVFSKQ